MPESNHHQLWIRFDPRNQLSWPPQDKDVLTVTFGTVNFDPEVVPFFGVHRFSAYIENPNDFSDEEILDGDLIQWADQVGDDDGWWDFDTELWWSFLPAAPTRAEAKAAVR